jgi:hypothetical protein
MSQATLSSLMEAGACDYRVFTSTGNLALKKFTGRLSPHENLLFNDCFKESGSLNVLPF